MLETEKLLRALLKEAIKIIHCHCRNTHKEWLDRARAALKDK